MTQKFMAETNPLRGPFDEAGNIGQYKAHLVTTPWLPDGNHTQVGRECGERIVGNLGVCGSHNREKSRFTGVGVADQANIGDQAQFEVEPSFLTRLTFLSFAWSLMGRSSKMGIAQATSPTTSNHNPLFILNKIGQQFVRVSVTDDRATGDGQHDIFALGTVHSLACAISTIISLKVMTIAVVNQRIGVGCSFNIDTTPSTTVPTVWATTRSKLFTTEVTGTVATIACFNVNFCTVIKHRCILTL